MNDSPLLGIDFGTSFSTACWWNPKSGMPEVIRNEHGEEKTPSVVYRGPDGGVLIGKPAVDQLADSVHLPSAEQAEVMARTFCSVKRKLKDNIPQALPDGTVVSPVELAADILRHIKRSAEQHCFNQTVTKVVLTHPVLFLQKEKDRLLEAAELAGFGEIILVEEPVAAVLGYAASGAKAGSGILVYDLGGGTLDLAFVHREDEQEYHIPVEPSGGVFGGDDFDQAVYDHFEGRLRSECGVGFSSDSGMVNLAVLMEARKCKEKLSSSPRARLSYLLAEQNRNVSYELTQADLENLIRDYVQRTVGLTRTMLQRVRDAGRALDTVVLVGGSTRIPLIQRELKACLPVEPLKTMHADVAVAMGAAAVAHEAKAAPERYPVKKTPIPIMEFTAAITAGSLTEVRRHIAHGADVNEGWYDEPFSFTLATPLTYAIAKGDTCIVDALLQAGARPDGLPKQNLPPVHMAALSGFTRAVALLLAAGANPGWTPLHVAAANGRRSEVSALLLGGAVTDCPDNHGWRALHLAAYQGREDIVKILLDAGADKDAKDADGITPLVWAAQGHEAVVKLLLDAGADKNAGNSWWTPLHAAASYGCSGVVKLLLDAGADTDVFLPSVGTPLHCAAHTGHEAVLKLLLDAGANRQTPYLLSGAAQGGHEAVVKFLLDAGINREATDLSWAFQEAAQAGHVAVAKLLFDAGADKDAGDQTGADREDKDQWQSTALHLAAREGRAAVVSALLASGAEIESRNKLHFSPLHCAADQGHEAVVKLLLDAGADLEARDQWLCTPLHLASQNGHTAVVRALLAARADIEARNKLHFSPLHCAADQGHEAVVKFLLDAGADLEGLGPGQSTALHLAAQNHHTAVVSALLAAGADSEARNEWTDTPLHCVVRSFIDSTCPVEAYVLGTIKLRTTATGQPKACTYTTRVSDGRRFWVQLRAGGITPMLNPMDNDLVGGILSGVETVVVPAEGDKAERSFEAGFLRVVMRMPQVATMLPLPVYDLGKIKLGTTKTGEPKASTFTTRVSDGRRFWVQLRACDNAPLLNLKEGELVSGVLLGVQTVVVPAKGDKAESRFEAGFLRVVVRMPQVATMLPLPVYVLGTIKLGTTKTGKPKASTFITRVSDGRRFWVQLRAGGNTPMLNPMDNDLVGGILRGVETVVVPAKGDKAEVSFEAGFLRVVTILPPASQYAANATTPEFLSSYLDWKISEEKACKATLASLLAEGTDIESRREDQCTPLLLASYFGAEHAVQMLLAGGANIETVDQGQRSPLHWAALKGHEAVAKLLIEAGADIEARALRQYTPLHWAAQKGHEAVVRALLEAGADPSAESSTGTTALDLAPPGTTVASLLSGNNEQRGSEAL